MATMKDLAIKIEDSYGLERHANVYDKIAARAGHFAAEDLMIALESELRGIYDDGYDAACSKELGVLKHGELRR